MNFKLGINTGFAVNRYVEPETWTELIGETLGLRYVQLTADMLNLSLPEAVLSRQVDTINKYCDRYRITIDSTFTGAFTRLNHLSHPDGDVRAYWIDWFKKFARVSADLGATSMGSHFGIFTFQDNNDQKKRSLRLKQNIEGWHQIADFAKECGLQYLSWEPMSIRREQGETIEATQILQKEVNTDAPLPFYLCLDLDHGDVSSPNPNDTDPYAWIAHFAQESPLIHLKQSTVDKGGHWPFIEPYNSKGRIIPEKVLKALRNHGSSNALLLLELSFREREPIDSSIVDSLKSSVAYWRPHVAD